MIKDSWLIHHESWMLSIDSLDRLCFGHPGAGEVSKGQTWPVKEINTEMLVGQMFFVQNASKSSMSMPVKTNYLSPILSSSDYKLGLWSQDPTLENIAPDWLHMVAPSWPPGVAQFSWHVLPYWRVRRCLQGGVGALTAPNRASV